MEFGVFEGISINIIASLKDALARNSDPPHIKIQRFMVLIVGQGYQKNGESSRRERLKLRKTAC